MKNLLTLLVTVALAGTVAATTHQVNIQNYAFSPDSLIIEVGDTVRWTNHDAVPHTSTAYDGTWNSGTLSQNQSYSCVFTSTGSHSYYCGFHPMMVGAVTVNSPTGIDQAGTLPERFSVYDNYPNPFNASTTIHYSLATASNVIVEIFDILGHRIETLLVERQVAGYHSVTWNAVDKPSGIYFYRVKADDSVQTKRMALLK